MQILLIGKGKSNELLKKELEKNNNVKFAIEDYEKIDNDCIYKKNVNINEYDMFYVAPGVPNNDPLLLELKKNNKYISSELEYSLNRLKNNKIIAITGSNGKTTVASLLSYILKKKNIKHVLAGNIGTPLVKYINISIDTLIILEVSSFQLERVNNLKPYISIITNITPNHLDRHSLEDYIKIKKKIYSLQDKDSFLITNNDTKYKYEINPNVKIKIIKRKNIKTKYLIGNHNIENINFVIQVLKILKIKNYIRIIKKYKGVKYRLEYLGKYKKTKIYNDAKSTTIYSTISALNSLKGKTLLILGGKNKNIDYSIINNLEIQKIIMYGEETKYTSLKINKYLTLKDAFKYVKTNILEYDNILFSPGFTSLDQYESYMERGKEFEKLCKESFKL